MKELVGQGKPFYSAVDKAAGLLKRKVGTGAEFMQELKGLGGIKQSEIEDRGLGDIMGAPKMTHEQFMAALAAKPAPAIQEVVLGGTRSIGNVATGAAPYHGEYTLPGGENYREMLIKAPKQKDYEEEISQAHSELRRLPYQGTPEQEERKGILARQMRELEEKQKEVPKSFPGVGAHFGGAGNILASMRLKDRTGPNGEKLLHLEELQSDWHQQGREKGYANNQPPYKVEADKNGVYRVRDAQGDLFEPIVDGDRISGFMTPEAAENAAQANIHRLQKASNAVPNAPFKKNWEEMALKRLIHHAAEKGYHGIVVTPGAEQADRYNLANHIDSLHFSRNSNGTVDINAVKDRNSVVDKTMQTPEQIESMVGKELAQKIFNTKTSFGSLEGLDLQVGGEGMKGFYDKKVPNILNAIGKKYGVKTELGGHKLAGDPLQRGDASERLGLAGERLADMSPEQVQAFNQKLDDSNAKQLHYFPITENMRKDVLTNGLPLHKEGGIIHKAVGGAVQPSINQMRAELMGKKPTSLSDLSTIGANEAPNMNVKVYVPPSGGQLPVGGVSMGAQPLPIGGIDMSRQQGQQLMPAGMAPPPQGQPPQADGMPSPLSAGASSPAQQPPSNILQMTPQGQALNAMTPPQPAKMAEGGGIPMTYKVGGSDNMPEAQPSWEPDDGEKTFNIDNLQQLAKGGSIEHMKHELKSKGTPCMTHDHGYADGGRAGKKSSNEPKSTVKAYKLFRMHPKHPGKLFPLFVNANEPVEMNKWVDAKEGEMVGDKVKSKIGLLAYRPGWHAGDLPVATHIGEKSDPNLTAPDVRPANHVWAEVEMPNDVDWQSVANERGMNAKGKLIDRNAHITDQIPKGGHYRYKTNSNMTGNWLIGGAMKVNRILHDKEVKAINKAAKAKDLPRAQKQNLADYGFKEGGSASPTQKSPEKFKPKVTKASEALGKHEGKHLKVTQSDRTKVGGGFLGGPGFSGLQHLYPSHKDVAWGVNSSGAASKIANANAAHPEGDVLWSTLIGAPSQHTSNQMVFDMLMKQFKGGIKGGKLTPELRDRINAQLAMAVDSEGKPLFANADIASKNFFKNLNTFDQRRVMADLMGGNKVGGKKGQIFNYDKTVADTTEPELLGAPTHAIGPRLFQLSGNRSVQPELNPAFPHMLHGEDLGQMFHPVPRQIMLPEFHGKIKQAKGRDVGFMDLTRNTPSQHLTEEFLTHLQKHGHKKGGKVKLSTNMDTINLELSRRTKKAK